MARKKYYHIAVSKEVWKKVKKLALEKEQTLDEYLREKFGFEPKDQYNENFEEINA